MMGSTSRGRSSYYGNGGGGGVGFFFGSSSERLLHPAATRRHDVVSASTAAAADHHVSDDLDEEDVWSAVTIDDNSNHHDRSSAHRPGPAFAGLSLAFEAEAASPPTRHSAAPVSVPVWPAATVPEEDHRHHHRDGSDLDDLEWVPPHEYLQRRRCRAGGAASASVLEGAGRTLKGRDITRVRDAVWSKTGFYG